MIFSGVTPCISATYSIHLSICELVATILDKVVVKKESTKDDIHLDIFLKLGSTYEAVYTPLKHTAGNTSLKNTTHKPPTRRI
ncbi:MAG: hypothetical protein BHW31_00260 [Firmicutes bacterium CAG:110_56_8]|nr:MAG: hypothetical protein BHW31_00260 [Firmicutes bacterium CAG:110_56_8]